MAGTEIIANGGVVTFTVKVSGNTIPDEDRVHSIVIDQAVNRIPTARVVILDGDPADSEAQNFPASSGGTYLPGSPITIEAGYDSKNKEVFKGIITRQSITVDGLIGASLELTCRDESVKMTVGRKSLTFSKKKDSEIISSIVGNYGGITPSITATETTWPEQVQYYASDWDYVLTRAETNGMIVVPFNGKLTVGKPDADTSSVAEIAFGDNMLTFSGDMDSVTQLGSAKASSWDYKTQKIVTGESSNSTPGPGNLSSKKLSEVVGLSNFELGSTTPLASPDLVNWTKAALVKSSYSKIRADVKSKGSSLIQPGKYITINGMGDRFDGDHLVSGVIHEIGDGTWTTESTLGLSFNWFSEEPDVSAPLAAGLLPGTRGLYNATVKKMNEDPDSEFRIQVTIPLLDPTEQGEGMWARLSNFYSTSGAGAFFLPEVGDEVIVGFLNEDPRFPVILGSLYSSNSLKPFSDLSPDEKNSKKAIVTKSELRIVFDDENKVLTIQTPGNNVMTFSDEDKKITITDQNENSIEMAEAGITMSSPKSITIKADQNVTIQGEMGVKIEASGGDVEVSGMNIKETADMKYSAEGSLQAQVQGGTELTLKGAMVMIN